MKNYRLKEFYGTPAVNYERDLNPQQLEVVQNGRGPCLVLAGAGSGKTRVLIYRLAWLLENGTHPQDVLLATFTNKAAREMTSRSELLLKSTLSGVWAGTFHHIGNMILRRDAAEIGYSPNFTIVDRQDACDLIQDSLQELGLLKHSKLFPKKNVIANIRSMAANCQKSVEKIIEEFWPSLTEHTAQLKRVIRNYETRKKKANIMDFDDLLVNWLKILKDKEQQDKYSRMFKYILVDEYQDTNSLQFSILEKMYRCHNNILAVGDDAQSIYSFRGARIQNLLDFPKTFRGARVFKLETNYRSSPQILHLANAIIKHNLGQFPKTLRAACADGAMPAAVRAQDVYQQAKFVSQRILELCREGQTLNNIAVLFRSRFQALELEMELVKRNIPYIIRGGMRFFEQSHIKDVMAHLKIVLNPDDEICFKRAVCLYPGIGRGWANKIWQKFRQEKQPYEEVKKNMPRRAQEGFRQFHNLIEKTKNTSAPGKAIQIILEFYRDWCQLSFDNAQDRILDLEELIKMAENYQTIKEFVLDLSSFEGFKGETRLNDRERTKPLVLSTIHQAKGLEWATVFIIGFSDYEFPHPRSLESDAALEEERRLFYVAATRAKSMLYITYPQNKYTFKNGLIIARASKFLHELGPGCFQEWNVQDPTTFI